jgi:hypothetical protein
MSRFISLMVDGDGAFFYTLIAPHLDAVSLLCTTLAFDSLRVNHARIVQVLERIVLQRLENACLAFGRDSIVTHMLPPGMYYQTAESVYRVDYFLREAVNAVNEELYAIGVRFPAEVQNAFRVFRVVNNMLTRDDHGWTYGVQPGVEHAPAADQPTTTVYLPHVPGRYACSLQAQGLALNPPVIVGPNWEVSHLLRITGLTVTMSGDTGRTFAMRRTGVYENVFMRGFGPLPRPAGAGNREEVAWLSTGAPAGIADP